MVENIRKLRGDININNQRTFDFKKEIVGSESQLRELLAAAASMRASINAREPKGSFLSFVFLKIEKRQIEEIEAKVLEIENKIKCHTCRIAELHRANEILKSEIESAENRLLIKYHKKRLGLENGIIKTNELISKSKSSLENAVARIKALEKEAENLQFEVKQNENLFELNSKQISRLSLCEPNAPGLTEKLRGAYESRGLGQKFTEDISTNFFRKYEKKEKPLLKRESLQRDPI